MHRRGRTLRTIGLLAAVGIAGVAAWQLVRLLARLLLWTVRTLTIALAVLCVAVVASWQAVAARRRRPRPDLTVVETEQAVDDTPTARLVELGRLIDERTP